MSTDSQPSSPSALPPIPSSPTYSYASTANPIPSSFNLPLPPPPRPPHAVLTKADLEASQTAYSDLLTTAKSYRLALAALSVSASTFGSALEACARLKEARSDTMPSSAAGSMTNSFSAKGNWTADNLMAASGVHQLVANHQQILSETVYRSFEVPLLHELDQWRRRMEEEEMSYQREAKIMSKEIRRMEKEGLRLHKLRKRDVGVFRQHLVQLTSRLDQLTSLSGGHSRGLLRDCQEMSKVIVECSAGLVRAEVDIFEALARKGWNGGGLDELLDKGRDLFANEESGTADAHPNHGAKIFSILPQNRSILANEDTSGAPGMRHMRHDSLLVEGLPYQSLTGAVSGGRDADVNSILSERDMPSSALMNRPRGVRPFSPTPGERVRDPLENYGKPALDVPKEQHEGENDVDKKNAEGQSGSTKTVVAIPDLTAIVVSVPEGAHVESMEEKEEKDTKEKERDSSESESESARSGRERMRRWSVTDDGAVSD
ncbi:related to IVY1-phospholipid-binding protein [Rhynchosporium secalis]|uniref:Related to IVY1-phospholipid-binding protein n=1 Tax=Rhynchosporium secalis TaxID=38038 RepID=A0A1E1MR09_RHYSE|nr:related to IVY1-phospholipid-binding protein [Rhynchosporium secalis]